MPSLFGKITSRSHRKTLKERAIELDKARVHNSRSSQKYIQAFKAERLPHPTYSPDTAPSDFFRFGAIKKRLTIILRASQTSEDDRRIF
jgi:hypothetical protein